MSDANDEPIGVRVKRKKRDRVFWTVYDSSTGRILVCQRSKGPQPDLPFGHAAIEAKCNPRECFVNIAKDPPIVQNWPHSLL